MLKLKEFFNKTLNEARLVGDYRPDEHKATNKPFVVAKPYTHKYNKNDYSKIERPKYSTMTFHAHADMHKMEGEERKNFSGTHRILVDPQNKIINLAPKSDRLNRRPATKIQNSSNNPKHSYPILGSDATEMPHLELRKTMHDIHKHHPIHDYTITGDDRFEGMKVKDFVRMKTPHERFLSNEPITMYHGTSVKAAKDIVKGGLRPGKRKGSDSYSNLIKGYSDKNVYLSTRPSEAANYATREAIHHNSEPVILKVQIHPNNFHNIRPDEDSMHWSSDTMDPHLLQHLIKKHPAIAGNHNIHFRMLTGARMEDGREASFERPIWSNEMDETKIPKGKTKEQYQEEIGRDFRDAWIHQHVSLHRNSSVAFSGNIHPKHISVHKTWKKGEKIAGSPSSDQYYSAIEKMKTTVKDKLD